MNDVDSASINLENSDEFRKFLEASLTDNSIQYHSLKELAKSRDLNIQDQPVSPSLLSQIYSLSPSTLVQESQREYSTNNFENVTKDSDKNISNTLSLSPEEMRESANTHSVLSNTPHSRPNIQSSKDFGPFASQENFYYNHQTNIGYSMGGDEGEFTDTFSELDTEDFCERTMRSLSFSHSHFGLETLKEIEDQNSQHHSSNSNEECSESVKGEVPGDSNSENNPSPDLNNSLILSTNSLHDSLKSGEESTCSIDRLSDNSPIIGGCQIRSVADLEPINEETEKFSEIQTSDQSDLEDTVSRNERSPSHSYDEPQNIETDNSFDSNTLQSASNQDLNDDDIEKRFPVIAVTHVTSLSEKVQALANEQVRSAAKLVIQKKKENRSRIPRIAKPLPKNVPPRVNTESETIPEKDDPPAPLQNIKCSKRVSFTDETNNVKSTRTETSGEDQILGIRNSQLEDLRKERRKSLSLTSELQLINEKYIEIESESNKQKNHTQFLEKELERVQLQLLTANGRIEQLIGLNNLSESVGESEEVLKIRRTLKEQDELIESYQKENEKIYDELKRIKEDKKTIETRFLKEKQTHSNEIYNLKSQLGLPPEDAQRELRFPVSDKRTGEVEYLEMMNEKGQIEIKELERQHKLFLQQISEQKLEINNLKQMLCEKSDNNIQIQEEKVQLIRSKYENETEDLKKQLKWYSDNQKLMEKDLAKVCKLQARNNELEREFGLIRSSDNSHSVVNNLQLKRIQELENQNSIYQEILSKAQHNLNPVLPESSAQDNANLEYQRNNELEIQRLEKALRDKETEYESKINSLNLKLQNMENYYNEKLKQQHSKLSAFHRDQQRTTHPHATVQSLLREIESVRLGSVAREQELTDQVAQLAQDKKQLKALVGTYKQRSRVYRVSPLAEDCGKKANLQDYCNSLQEEILHLRERCKIVQTERYASTGLEIDNDKLNREMERLKYEFSMVSEQLQSEKSKHLQELSSEREIHRLELEKELTKHAQNLNALKMHYAVQYSDSQTAQLSSDNASLKLQISWLEDKMEEYREKSDQNEQLSANEDKLNRKIQLLSNELIEARQHQRPEMRHFVTLKETITKLENRLKEQENMLRSSAAQNSILKPGEGREREEELQMMLARKDREIENFKRELDALLCLMRQLQR